MKKLLLISASLVFMFSCTDSSKSTETVETKAETVPVTEEISEATPEVSAPEKVLRHVVMFKFKETSAPEDIQKVEEAFSELPSKIDVIRDYEWGTNNSPEGLDKGFTHVFFVTFHSEDDRATYLPHPDHQAFVEVLKPHLEDVLVLDYWTE